MIAVLLALLAAQPVEAAPPLLFDPVSPQEAAERVSRCGLGEVSIGASTEEGEEGLPILVAPEAGAASDAELACAVTGASLYPLELPERVRDRYARMREAHVAAFVLARATDWVAEHGLAGRIPEYRPGVSDDRAFARGLERLCGPAARGAFGSRYGYHALSPDRMKRRDPDAIECLVNVTTVAGYDIGFIGNEAVKETPTQERR